MALALAVLVVCAFASGPDDRLPEPIRSLVEAERRFSAHSVEHGTRSAFLRFLGDEAVVFTPRSTRGRRFYRDQPEEPEPRSTLVWRPIFADVAASGDFGYTTGPYELSFARNGVPAKSYGHYVTVWTKTAEGFRVAIDKGIRHPEPFRAGDEVDFPPDGGKSSPAPVSIEEILELDRSYSFEHAASDSIRLYRDGAFPVVGKENARRVLETPQLALSPEGGAVASSGDLAFTYGTAKSESAEHAYLHIWKKEGPSLRLVLDNATPLPPEVKP